MKTELLDKLEMLLNAEKPLEVVKEFNAVSSQLKSLLDAATNPDATDEDHDEDQEENQTDSEAVSDAEAKKSESATSIENTTKTKVAEVEIVQKTDKVDAIVNKDEPVSAANSPHESKSEAESKETETPVSEEGNTHEESSLAADDNEVSTKIEASAEEDKATAAVVPEEGSYDDNDQETSVLDVSERFKEITAAFRKKLSDARAELKRREEETVATAKDLLDEMHRLVESEENIGKAFAGFNAIQEKWKSLDKVGNDNYRDLNADYNKQVERFFYNINIYKELKELDLKRNLEEKQLVLADQKKLLDINDIRLLELEVRLNQDRWNEIGPTFKEDWEKLKDEFWGITKTVYKKIQDFYNQRKAAQETNLIAKKELLEKAKQLSTLDLKSHKKWQAKTNEVIELQKQWKLIGFVPKDQVGPVWKEFRETCDSFFERKRAFYNEIHVMQEAARKAKEAVIQEAETWKESTEWKVATDKFIALQKQWKSIGPAHQKDENKLWKQFRETCDQFFQAKNAGKTKEIKAEAENLEAKQAIIQELESFVPNQQQSREGLETLRGFSEQWRAIGHVPFKEKDNINKAYRKLMDEKFAVLKVDRREKEKMRFEEKIDLLKSSDTKDKLVQKERDFIRSKISKIESEINQYENNLGFFANSKGADKLKAEVIKKIDKAKEEVEELYEQINMLSNVE